MFVPFRGAQTFFFYSTTYNAYRDYNTNNVNITYEAKYKKYETILRLDTTEIRLI